MDSPMDIINESLDLISGQLRDLSVEVSPFASQLMMLVLILVILATMRKKFLPLSNLDGKSTAALAVPTLIGLAILVSWADQFFDAPEKYVVSGVIHAEHMDGLVMDLLGPDGLAMQSDDPVIELPSGEFFAHYTYSVTVYPRQIRISQKGCCPTLTPVTLAQLRASHEFQIMHHCNPDG